MTTTHLAICIPAYSGTIRLEMMECLLHTKPGLERAGVTVSLETYAGCSNITKARNELANAAMAAGATHLLWLDDDLSNFAETDILNMLETGHDYIGAPVLGHGGRCFNVSNARPVEGTQLLEVDAIGTAFLLLSRHAMDRIATISPAITKKNYAPRAAYFETAVIEGRETGEDWLLSLKWRSLGGKVYADPRCRPTHHVEFPMPTDAERRIEPHHCAGPLPLPMLTRPRDRLNEKTAVQGLAAVNRDAYGYT